MRASSPQAWENFRSRVTELGGVVLESEWLGALTPHLCRCAEGHECKPRPATVQQGSDICRECAYKARINPRSQPAWERFRCQVAELGGEVLESEWLGALTPHLCRCSEWHECKPRPASVQQGGGVCQICAYKTHIDPRSQPAWENFRSQVAELGGEVLEPEYLGNSRPHRCRCAEGHECKPRPGSVKQGRGICQICAGNDSVTAWENFRQRITELGGEVLEREWLGVKTPHRCRCADGHECSPRPNSIRQGQGMCRVCAGQDSVTAEENFRKRVAELGGEVLEPEYLGSHKPHRCRCVEGHECNPMPNDVQQGRGICGACAGKDLATNLENFRKRVAELGGTVLEPEWLGSQTHHRCLCAKDHECNPTPNNASKWGICKICAGNDSVTAWENFRRRVTELGGEVLELEWLGGDKLHRCRCVKGHECSPRPAGVQQGGGICRACAGKDPVIAWDNFRKRVAELGGEVLEPEYLGSIKPHRCRCANGHECNPIPHNAQKVGDICRICSGLDPATALESFCRRVIELGGEVLETSWLGVNKPHRCRCVNGHQCKPAPASVRQGNGICLVCAGKDPVTARDNFYRRVAELGGEVLEPEWRGVGKPHLCRCVNGHECRPWPTSVQQGRGICQVCSWLGQTVLYVTRNPVTCCVKFGITSWDGSARLYTHRRDGYTEVLHLFIDLPEGLAAHTEQKIKLALAMVDAEPVRGLEYFSDDYLDLIENEIGNWIPEGLLKS